MATWTDNANRANEAPRTGWSSVSGFQARIVGNQFVANATADTVLAYLTAAAGVGASQFAEVTLRVFDDIAPSGDAATHGCGPAIRVRAGASSAGEAYYAICSNHTTNAALRGIRLVRRHDAGSGNAVHTVLAFHNVTLVAGDIVRIEVDSAFNIIVRLGGTSVITFDDNAAAEKVATGSVGDYSGVFNAFSEWDDWGGGDLGPAGDTWYPTTGAASGSNHGALSDTAPATATSGTGWIVGTTAVNNYSRMDFAVERLASTFGATAQPSSGPDNTLGDCFRTPSVRSGSYAAGDWTFSLPVRAVTLAAKQDGRLRVRVWRSVNADGSSPTEITASTLALSEVTDLGTSADSVTSGTVALGAITLTDEYLFIQLAWHITGITLPTISHVAITQGASTSNVISFDTASVSFVSGRLYVLGVVSSDAAPETDPSSVITVGGVLTFTKHVAGISHDTIASPLKKLTIWRAIAASSFAAAIRITLPDAGTGCAWMLHEFAGHIDTTTPLGTAATNAANAAASISATPGALVSLGSLQLAFGANDINSTTNNEPSGTNWVEVGTPQNYNTPPTSIASALNSSGVAQQVTFGTTTADRAVIAVEIRANTAANLTAADVALRVGSASVITLPVFTPSGGGGGDVPFPEDFGFGALSSSYGLGVM